MFLFGSRGGGAAALLPVLGGAVILALLTLYCAACILSLRPRAGTLDWIADYGRPALPLLGRAQPMTRADIAPALGISALAAALWSAVILPALRYQAPQTAPRLAATVLQFIAAPAVTAALTFSMCRRLFGRTASAALAAALVAVDLASAQMTMVFSAAGLFFLVRFLTAREEAGFADVLPPLAGCFAFLAAGCYFDASLFVLAGAALLAVIGGCAARCRRTGQVWLLRAVLTAVVTMAAALILVYLPAGYAGGMALPRALLSPGYYAMILARIGGDFAARLAGPPLLNVVWLQYNWALALGGLLALGGAAADLFAGRDHRGGLLLVCFAAQAAAFAFLDSRGLSLSCALCLCHVWTRLERRRRFWLAAVGAGCLLTLSLAASILSFFRR